MVTTSEALARYRKVWRTGLTLRDLRRFLDESVGKMPPVRLSVILLDQELRWMANSPLPLTAYLREFPELKREPASLLELSISEDRLRETQRQRQATESDVAPAAVGGVSLQFFGEKLDPVTRMPDTDFYDTVVVQVAAPAQIPLFADFDESPDPEQGMYSAGGGEDDHVDSLLLGGLPAAPGPWQERFEWLQARWADWSPLIVRTLCALLLLAAGLWLVRPWLTRRMEGQFAGQRRQDNGLEMPLVWCQPGHSIIGSPEGEMGRHRNETQVETHHTVGYWVGQSEVTQDQYTKVMYANPSHFSITGPGRAAVRNQKTGQWPVENVSPAEIREFCRRFTAIERQAQRLPADWEYTLPTEAQWETACRAGGPLTYGDSNRLSAERGHYDQPENGTPRSTGLGPDKSANAWGIVDMLGNVSEICRDSYRDELTPGLDPWYLSTGDRVVIRGGSWRSSMHNCRPAWRDEWGLTHRANWLGFRVALTKVRPEPAVQTDSRPPSIANRRQPDGTRPPGSR